MATNLHIVPRAEHNLSAPATQNQLDQKIGIVERIKAGRVVKKEASRVATELKVATLQAQERIGKSEIAIAEIQIKGAIVANGLADLGALVEDIDQKTGAVKDRLTASMQAQWALHIETRGSTSSMIGEYISKGLLTAEEGEALMGRANANMASNINAGQRQHDSGSEATEIIRNFALSGLRRAAESIK